MQHMGMFSVPKSGCFHTAAQLPKPRAINLAQEGRYPRIPLQTHGTHTRAEGAPNTEGAGAAVGAELSSAALSEMHQRWICYCVVFLFLLFHILKFFLPQPELFWFYVVCFWLFPFSFCTLSVHRLFPPRNKSCYALGRKKKNSQLGREKKNRCFEQKKTAPQSIQVSSIGFICSRTEGVYKFFCQPDAHLVVLPMALRGAALRRISLFRHIKLSLTPAEFDKSLSCVKAE